MTVEQVVAILGAVTALVIALGALYREIRNVREIAIRNHERLNGQLHELLDVTILAARKEGELIGRDYERGPPPPAQSPPG